MRKYYNLELRKIISVTGLKTVEILSLDKSFFFPEESHPFHEFVYVLSGEIFCCNGDKKTLLNAGEFMLTLPQISHKYFTKNNAEIFIICFTCKSSVLSVFDKQILLSDSEKALMEKLIFEIKNSFELPFEERVRVKENAPIGAQQITENTIEELLIKLLRTKLVDNAIQTVKSKSELQLTLVNEIEKILKENLYNKISLSKICNSLFYTSTYLNGIFKEYKKTTIMKYYTILKIDQGKKLLSSNLSVQEISDKLCFDNANYFTKTFKSITGLTPTEYKKKNAK